MIQPTLDNGPRSWYKYHDDSAYVMLIEAAAPFAVLTVSLADLYNRKPDQVALASFISLIGAAITLPIFWWLVR